MSDDGLVSLGPLVSEALARLKAQLDETGQTPPDVFNIVERVTIRKFDHTPDVPVLVEERVISERRHAVPAQE